MAKIKIDIEALRDDSRVIAEKIQELSGLNTRLDTLISSIDASWDGEASMAYVSMMRNYERQADSMVAILTEFKTYVDQAVTKFEDVDKKFSSQYPQFILEDGSRKQSCQIVSI